MTHFWQLRIRELNHRDAGKYECQVSTTPPRGHQMYLKVVGNENVKYKIHTMKATIILNDCFTINGTSLLVDFSVWQQITSIFQSIQ